MALLMSTRKEVETMSTNAMGESFKPGDKVRFWHYGQPRKGTIETINNGIVWLTTGRWLHVDSVSHLKED